MSWEIREGDALERLREMPDASVHCVVTSPPYWGLRDYGVAGQLGLERTPDEYTAAIVGVFGEVRRVLRGDGTLWLNLGDSYMNAKGQAGGVDPKQPARRHGLRPQDVSVPGLKPKDLVGIPWAVAFALRADGWYLRSDVIWSKPNAMPEPVEDRPTKAHEYLFLLSKGRRYFYDAEAVAEPYTNGIEAAKPWGCPADGHARRSSDGFSAGTGEGWSPSAGGRNRRSVWSITTSPYPSAHFATFPPELPELCIKAGCPEGGTVLDPFAGAGTTGMVALRLGRSFIGIELNPAYAKMARHRIHDDAPLLNANGGAA